MNTLYKITELIMLLQNQLFVSYLTADPTIFSTHLWRFNVIITQMDKLINNVNRKLMK